jgi:hypothetical protein
VDDQPGHDLHLFCLFSAWRIESLADRIEQAQTANLFPSINVTLGAGSADRWAVSNVNDQTTEGKIWLSMISSGNLHCSEWVIGWLLNRFRSLSP